MADTKQSADTPTTGARAPQALRPSVGQRVMDVLRGPMVSNPNAPNTQRGAMGRYFRNMILFFVLAEALTFGMEYVNVQFKLHLEQPIPGVSWLSWMLLINLVIIAGVFLGLRSMGFFPTDMFSPQANSAARGSSSAGATGGSGSRGSAKVEIPGIGKARTRAERRYAQIAAEQAAAAAAAAKAKGKNRAASSSKAVTATNTDTMTVDEHDDAYERAKAAQRLRKRRALR